MVYRYPHFTTSSDTQKSIFIEVSLHFFLVKYNCFKCFLWIHWEIQQMFIIFTSIIKYHLRKSHEDSLLYSCLSAPILMFFFSFWGSQPFSAIIFFLFRELPLAILQREVFWQQILCFPSSKNVFLSPFLPRGYFHWIQNSCLTVLFFQYLKTVALPPSGFRGSKRVIYCHSNWFSLLSNECGIFLCGFQILSLFFEV